MHLNAEEPFDFKTDVIGPLKVVVVDTQHHVSMDERKSQSIAANEARVI